MKSLALALAVAAALLGCARYPGCPAAQAPLSSYAAEPVAAVSGSTQGTVESVAPDLCSLTLRGEGGGLESVQLTGGTLVASEGEGPGGLDALSPGQRVRVSYRRYGESLVADEVRIVTGGAAPHQGP